MVKKLLIIILFIPFSVYASVVASVNTDKVELGESVTYSLSVSGNDITKPNIYRLCNSDVISTSSSKSINIMNGRVQESNILSYEFVPQKSCEIAPTEIEIDGVMEKSNALSIKVIPVSASKDKNFILELISSKKDVLVGESFKVSIIFKQKRGSRAVDSEFIAPELKSFWIKNKSDLESHDEGAYNVSKIVYTLSAQREGTFEIPHGQIKIAFRVKSRNSWGAFIPQIKWKNYFSNDLKINVKALPQNINFVGDFKIKTNVDKRVVNANEAVNLTLEVMGDGNLEDMTTFKPSMQNANVFDEKIKYEKNKITQKMAFVADDNFTIPSFSLEYLDLKTNKIKTISTKEIKIEVKNAKKEKLVVVKDETPIIKYNKNTKSESLALPKIMMIEIFIFGLIIGMILMYFRPWKLNKTDKKTKLTLKDEKLLLVKLLSYKEDEEVKKLLDILENNLYSSDKKVIDKKVLKKILKKYNIS
jgi:hypothetical protein